MALFGPEEGVSPASDPIDQPSLYPPEASVEGQGVSPPTMAVCSVTTLQQPASEVENSSDSLYPDIRSSGREGQILALLGNGE